MLWTTHHQQSKKKRLYPATIITNLPEDSKEEVARVNPIFLVEDSSDGASATMEVEDCDQDDINTTGPGGDANLRKFSSRVGKPRVEISSIDSDDDDEPEILESNFEAKKTPNNIKKQQVLKNPLHVTKEPEFIDLTEEDQDMVSEADDSDIIVEGIVEDQSRHMEEEDDDDDDLPVLVEVPPLSKKE